MFKDKSILITGGTGSFGKQMLKRLLDHHSPRKVVVFSRDELKQHDLAQHYPHSRYPNLRMFIGDVRDENRLDEAFHGIDYVIHAAALKQVPTAEYNPFEAIKTNVLGAQNVIRASIRQKVKKVVALSTDKAANPINLYGATKLCSDKLFVSGNYMAGDAGTRFCVVRYGNVVGSRGSVIPFFVKERKSGVIPITDERMTRFSITLDQGVDFVISSFERMMGGEIFVPKIPSYRILDVAKAAAPEASIKIVGIRPGEKLHEVMVPEDEARLSFEFDDHFVIAPPPGPWGNGAEVTNALAKKGGRQCEDGFSYNSRDNKEWLSSQDLRKLVDDFCKQSGIDFG
jgi:UDP-N-acetylglucosamine 4,6-dehydratase